MTFSKAWLEKKIMCGLCNFGCCNHQNFHVEITKEEQEKYRKEFGLDLELEWPQDGCCDLLHEDGSGCSLGNDRQYFVNCIRWWRINQVVWLLIIGHIYIVLNHKIMNWTKW